jgi:hypothetical protein
MLTKKILELNLLGKSLLILGIIIVLIGAAFLWGNKIPFLGKLPGDIYIQRGRVGFYFPLTTCVIISLILTLIFTLLFKR